MRIAFVGSHGCGKESVLIEIQKRFPHLNYITNIASSTLKENNITNIQNVEYNLKNIIQLDIFNNQIKKEFQYKDLFISERSILDTIAYSKGLEIQGLLKTFAKEYLKKYPYDKIYFFKNESFGEKKEDISQEYTEFQEFIQIELLKILHEFDIKYEEIIGNKFDRIMKISSYINSKTLKSNND